MNAHTTGSVQGVGLHEYNHPLYGDLIKSKIAEQSLRGRTEFERVIHEVQNEAGSRKDYIVRPNGIDFAVDANGIYPILSHAAPQEKIDISDIIKATETKNTGLVTDETVKQYNLTRWATQQLLAHAGIPLAFYDRLTGLKDYEWVKQNLNRLLPQTAGNGLLLREVNGTVKGVLTSSYKRIDASPIFEAFVAACIKFGYIPYKAGNTDTRIHLDFVRPVLHTPTVNANGKPEIVLFGLRLQTSDYGRGAVQLALAIVRVWCANLAAGDSILRKIHIGRRFDSDDSAVVNLSARTHDLDTKTVSSAITDIVGGFGKHAEALATKISEATSKEVKIDAALEALKKQGFAKATLEQARTLFTTEQPVESLPPGNTAWRLSNCLSLLAQSAKDGDARIDLENAAFKLIAA